MKLRVYVAGPISKGDFVVNTRRAIDTAEELRKQGYVPYVPHLDFLWRLIYPLTWDEILTFDEEWVSQCHALLRLYGYSPGADREVRLAEKLGIPVFFNIDDLNKFREAQEANGNTQSKN